MIKFKTKLLSFKLSKDLNRFAGRNNTGSITVRHKIGGTYRRFRKIDVLGIKKLPGVFKSEIYIPKKITYYSIYAHSDQSYTIVPSIKSSTKLVHYYKPIYSNFNNQHVFSRLFYIRKSGLKCYNVQFSHYTNARIASAPGTSVKVLRFGYLYTIIRIPSGEIRRISSKSLCSIGQLPNPKVSKFANKAGFSSFIGYRPTVRGVAMNPVDHPHGGNTSPGKNSVSPWAKLAKAKGLYSRNFSRKSTKLILYRRHLKKKF